MYLYRGTPAEWDRVRRMSIYRGDGSWDPVRALYLYRGNTDPGWDLCGLFDGNYGIDAGQEIVSTNYYYRGFSTNAGTVLLGHDTYIYDGIKLIGCFEYWDQRNPTNTYRIRLVFSYTTTTQRDFIRDTIQNMWVIGLENSVDSKWYSSEFDFIPNDAQSYAYFELGEGVDFHGFSSTNPLFTVARQYLILLDTSLD